jgi:type II secretory pathway component HofQ
MITYDENEPGHTMQIDMQEPMIIDSVLQENRLLTFKREGNVYWVSVRDSLKKYSNKSAKKTVHIYFV